MRVLIVGAGLYGATCARELKDKGHDVLVVEKREHLAGNCYTRFIPEVGCHQHVYGAHIFHTGSERIWQYARRFAEFNRYVHHVKARAGGKDYSFPINLSTMQQVFGRGFTPTEARVKLERERYPVLGEIKSMEHWCLANVGKRLYELFVEGYSEKQWGRHPRELPASIIKRIPIRFTYDESYFGSQRQGIPIGGYTAMVEGMLEGVSVELGVDYLLNRLYYYEHGEFDLIVYTGPIDAYFGYRLGHLEYRSLRFEDELVDVDDYQGNAVVNYLERDVPYTRIIEHKHFDLLQNNTRTLITREYPAAWEPGKNEYYPLNDQRNDVLFKQYRELVKQETQKVHFGGRLGEYRYLDMDQTIASALKFCNGIA